MIRTQLNRLPLFPVILACLATMALHGSDVPALINYQGKLVDASGNPASSGTYGMEFRIWDDASSDDETNNLVWGEETVVFVLDGSFNVILGQGVLINNSRVSSLREAFDGEERYLGLTVTTDASTNALAEVAEVTPRQQFLATGFAVQAQTAFSADSATTAAEADNALSLGGIPAASYAIQQQVITPGFGGNSGEGLEFASSEVGEDNASIRFFQEGDSGSDGADNTLEIATVGDAEDNIRLNAAGSLDLISGSSGSVSISGGSDGIALSSTNGALTSDTDSLSLASSNGASVSSSTATVNLSAATSMNLDAGTKLNLEAEGDITSESTGGTHQIWAAENALSYAQGNARLRAGVDSSLQVVDTSATAVVSAPAKVQIESSNLNLDVDNVYIGTGSTKPFLVRKYTISGSTTTGVSASSWVAVIAGIEGYSNNSVREARMTISNGDWYINWSDGASASGIVHVMFIRTPLVKDERF